MGCSMERNELGKFEKQIERGRTNGWRMLAMSVGFGLFDHFRQGGPYCFISDNVKSDFNANRLPTIFAMRGGRKIS